MNEGIELRDWFAGMAMQALINTANDRETSCEVTGYKSSICESARLGGWSSTTNIFKDGAERYTFAEFIAFEAYEIADAMMRESKEEMIKRSKVLRKLINDEGNDKK